MMRLTRDQIARVCSPCAERMDRDGLKEIKFSSMKQMPPELLEGLCDEVNGGAMDGFFTACMDHDFGEFGPPTEEFCAWLHNECFGKWPAEKEEPMPFIGLRPDSTIRAALAVDGGVDPDDLHLTMCYLGDTEGLPEEKVAALPAIVQRHVRETPPFDVVVDGQARWYVDDDGWAHVAMVSDPTGELHMLRDSVMSAAAFLGLEPRGKGVYDWRPHITLAYTEDPDEAVTMRPEIPMELTVDRVVVVVGDEVHHVDLESFEEGEDVLMSDPAELAGPLVAKDDERQVAYAPVLVPGEPDLDGDTLTEERIEKVAHEWLERFRAHDVRHDMQAREGIRPVESWIMRSDEEVDLVHSDQTITLPKGTWCVGSKIEDDSIWAKVKSGELGGVSIAGVRRERLEQAMKGDTEAIKRTTLADLGDDWTVPLVSIVGSPAVPKAKWFALKASERGKMSMGMRMKNAFRADKEGMRFSQDVLERLQAAAEVLNTLVSEAHNERDNKKRDDYRDKSSDEEENMSEEQMTQVAEQVVQRHIEPLAEGVEAIKSHLSIGEEGDDSGDSGDDRVTALEQENESLKSENESLKETLGAVEERLGAVEEAASVPRAQKAADEDADGAVDDGGSAAEPATPRRDSFGRSRAKRKTTG